MNLDWIVIELKSYFFFFFFFRKKSLMYLVFGQQAYTFLRILDGNATKLHFAWVCNEFVLASLCGLESNFLLDLGRTERAIQKNVRTSPNLTPKSEWCHWNWLQWTYFLFPFLLYYLDLDSNIASEMLWRRLRGLTKFRWDFPLFPV